jgi:hypothetical protein
MDCIDEFTLKDMIIKGKNQAIRRQYLAILDSKYNESHRNMTLRLAMLEEELKRCRAADFDTNNKILKGSVVSVYLYMDTIKEKKLGCIVLPEIKIIVNFCFYCKSQYRAELYYMIKAITDIRKNFTIGRLYIDSDYLHSIIPTYIFTGKNKDGTDTKNTDLIVRFRELIDKAKMLYVNNDFIKSMMKLYCSVNYIQEVHDRKGWVLHTWKVDTQSI